MKTIYQMAKEFRQKYPRTIAWRLLKHSNIVEKHLHNGETVSYVFCGQKNISSLMWNKSCVVAITNERLVIGQKRLLWGYFFTTITPDVYNDFKVINNLIWSDILIDTLDEEVYISNLDPNGAIDVQKHITKFMMEEKKKYATKKDK